MINDMIDDHKTRWRTATSAAGLTWGEMLDGRALVRALEKHAQLAAADILEIGPGYGRLPQSLAADDRIRSYVGIDLSPHWTHQLRLRHGALNPRFSFHCADAEKVTLTHRLDIICAFLTFKHCAPDFSALAENCAFHLRERGRLIFDVPETSIAWPPEIEPPDHIELETGCFTRSYTREQITDLLATAGLKIITFDELYHTPEKRRLLVVAAREDS